MILITGGAGFIGANLCLALSDYKIRILDNLSPQVHGFNPEIKFPGNVEFVHGSVTDRESFLRALKNIDVVIHLAAATGTSQSMTEIKHYSDTNIGGTALLCDLIVNEKLPVKKVILASSRAVYGEGSCSFPTSEDSPLLPVSIYGVTKIAQENMLLVIGRQLGISIIALRFQNVYGIGQSMINPHTGIIPIFCRKLFNNETVEIFDSGKISRDFVFIDDAIDAIVKALKLQKMIQTILNVGSGESSTLIYVATMLKTLCKSKSRISVSDYSRAGDIKNHSADLSKVKQILEFKPKTLIDDGLNKFVQWAQEQSGH